MIQPNHSTAQGSDQIDLVGRDDHRRADLDEAVEQTHHALGQRRVEIAGGFVGDQQLGAVRHRPRDHHPLALARR